MHYIRERFMINMLINQQMSSESQDVSIIAKEFNLNSDFTWVNEPVIVGKSGVTHKFDLIVTSKKDQNVKVAVLNGASQDLINDIMKFNEAVSDCGIQLKALLVDRDLDEKESKLVRDYNIVTVDKRKKESLKSDVLDKKDSDYIKKVAEIFQVDPDTYEVKKNAYEEGISGTKHLIDVLLVPKKGEGKIALAQLKENDFINEVMVFNSKTQDLNIPFKAVLVSRDLTEREKKLLDAYNIKLIDLRDQPKNISKVLPPKGTIFGIEEIDKKIGNVIKKGNVYMISGKTGVGKTTACIHFLVTGAKMGEKGAMILTDTRPAEFIANASSFSLGFDEYYKNRMIEVMEFSDQIREMKYEVVLNRKEEKKFITKITTEIKKFVVANNISRLVIDPITPVLVGEDDFINVLLSGLAMPNITTIITSNVRATDVSFFGIEEYYCSGVIKLEFANAGYGIRRLSVLKMRGGSYDSTPLTFNITDNGIVPIDEGQISASKDIGPILKPYKELI
ncbi:MAG: ATPase domain-containing protein [Thermoplasmatales archaeon]